MKNPIQTPPSLKKDKPKSPLASPMEFLNSAINDTWKLCTLGGFLGLFLLSLLLSTNPQSLPFSTSLFLSQPSPAAAPSPTTAFKEVVVDYEIPANQTNSNSSAPAVNVTSSYNSTELSTAAVVETPVDVNETSSYNSTEFSTAAVVETPPTVNVTSSYNSTEFSTAAVVDTPAAVNETSSYNSTEFSTSAVVETPAAVNETSSYNSTEFSTTAVVEKPAAVNVTSSFNTTEFIDQLLNSTSGSMEDRLFTSSTSQDQGDQYSPEAVAEGPTGEPMEEGSSGNKGEKEGQKCKIYEGKWVYKPEENPRYRVRQCPFLEEKMSCQKNGRPDFEYEGWSWESDGCQIPLFDGKDMLERMRGKRMFIAGDSLNRNKWESLACLLYTSIPSKRAYVDAGGPAYKVLKALDYDFTLEFYWAPFLVDFNPKHPSGRRVLTLDRLVPAAKQWRGADVMVFNSGHWWTHDRGRFKPYDVFEYGGEQLEKMQTELAYDRALSTWSDWLAHNVDPTKTKVYYRSISPEHKNKDWCFNTSRPIQDESYEQLYPRSMINVLEGKLREINGREGVHVSYLNITKLSTYRKDAHPGIFRFKHWKIITQKYKRLIKEKSDCSHWCLPGLPDTWNRLLYASLFFDHLTPGELSIS